MPRGRELLERFRPVGTPGAAAARGVPADRVAELAAELAPVFELLEATQQECGELRQTARIEATARRTAAAVEAEAALSNARREAQSVRAAAASALTQAADAAAEETLEAARGAAAAVRDAAARRLPELEGAVVAVMASRLAELMEHPQ